MTSFDYNNRKNTDIINIFSKRKIKRNLFDIGRIISIFMYSLDAKIG